MSGRKQIRQSTGTVSFENTLRTKQEWIEGAAALKRERFEVAGALFNCRDKDELSKQEVEGKLAIYLGLQQESTKEEIVNVDTTE